MVDGLGSGSGSGGRKGRRGEIFRGRREGDASLRLVRCSIRYAGKIGSADSGLAKAGRALVVAEADF